MIAAGKHAVIVGQNGSGKSQQLITLARENKQQVIIFDTKLDDDFLSINSTKQKLVVANGYREFVKALRENKFDYLIVRPQKFEISEPKALDNYLDYLTDFKNLSIFIDEAYPFHTSGGRCYEGLLALLTRGRSSKLSVIACTQRPSWVSNFIFSEASYFYIYRLVEKKDRQRVAGFAPYNAEIPPKFHFYYYDLVDDLPECELCEPIKLFKPRRKDVKKPFLTLIEKNR